MTATYVPAATSTATTAAYPLPPSRPSPVTDCLALLPSDLVSTRTRHHATAAAGTALNLSDFGFGQNLPDTLMVPRGREKTPRARRSSSSAVPSVRDDLTVPTTVELLLLSRRRFLLMRLCVRARRLLRLMPTPSPSQWNVQQDLRLARLDCFRARRMARLLLAPAAASLPFLLKAPSPTPCHQWCCAW